jgi:hypothetical protein
MERDRLLRMWDESWDKGIWAASWSAALTGLTPEQAAWRPGPARHNIWQNLNHVSVWREVTLSKLSLFPARAQEEVDLLNFEDATSITPLAWDAAISRFKRAHDALRAAIADPAKDVERAWNHLTHDHYHLGQIMQLRSLQGLPPIE